jgi:hypothetical protein
MYDEMVGLTRDQYDWQRQQADMLNARGWEEAQFNRGLQQRALDWATVDRDRADRYYGEAYAYDPEADARANRDRWRAEAGAQSQQALSEGQGQLTRGLARMGVNPNSGKYVGLANQNQVLGSLGVAANVNNAARAGDLAVQAAKAEKLNVRGAASGRANPGGYLGMSSGFGMTGLGAAGTGMGAYGSAFSGLSQGFGTAMNFANGANQGFDSIYAKDLQRSQSGWGPALGSIAGQGLGIAGGAWLGSKIGRS